MRTQPGMQVFTGGVFRGQPVLRRRREIGHSGLDLPDPAHLRVHVAGGFQDPVILIQQQEIGMPAHDLEHQAAQHMVAQLVDRVQVYMDDPIAADLADGHDARAGQLLAQQHAHGRRLQRVGIGTHGQVAAGIVRRRAEKQAAIFAACADEHDDGVTFGLGDLVHPPAAKHFVQFPGGETCRQSVHWHNGNSLSDLLVQDRGKGLVDETGDYAEHRAFEQVEGPGDQQ